MHLGATIGHEVPYTGQHPRVREPNREYTTQQTDHNTGNSMPSFFLHNIVGLLFLGSSRGLIIEHHIPAFSIGVALHFMI